MTILYPERFHTWKPAGFDGVFDWEFLRGAFNEKIQPMDLDAVVERKGNILVYETKTPGKDIPLGQWITLHALLSTHRVTVFYIQGKNAKSIVALTEFHCPKGMVLTRDYTDIDFQFVFKRSKQWFEYANKNPKSVARRQ